MAQSSVITVIVHARPSRVSGDVISANVLCEWIGASNARLKSGAMQVAPDDRPARCRRTTDLATRLASGDRG
jgi:hypothetical protein